MNLNLKKSFVKYFNISEVLSANQVYKFFSLQNPENLIKSLNCILNSINNVKRRGKGYLL